MEGILKRKFADVEDNPRYSPSPPSSLSSPGSSEWESDGESSSSDKRDFTPHSPSPAATVPSRSPNLPHLSQTSLSNRTQASLISPQQHCYENANLGPVLDNTPPLLPLDYLCRWVEDHLPEH
ncbi:unnamed protein product [Tetraodon nigroviridis]|uniref:(spotted green pufferfish) hypothetical protein n=1 Tax=Tetraodon nigroviridis TaxID=99883 RepID=Q4SNV5_TETNG|nr:unnamed protein product [Tetraodon nigroviridis]